MVLGSKREWKFKDVDFCKFPVYEGNDLGIVYSEEKTNVRIWAPTADKVFFRIYPDGLGGEPVQELVLEGDIQGTWRGEISGNLEGMYYTIQVRDTFGWLNEIPDIYAYSTGANGCRGKIVDFSKTNPRGWTEDQRVLCESPTDMVIYETHVRDFSMSPSSGIKAKGKFLGFTELGTKLDTGETTGLDHLKQLGITHVHLLPVADFYTVDELNPDAHYNWGYDPLNYNTVEGWYSTHPADGITRISEFKQLVMALHEQGIGVIVDVVYNHTGLIYESYFNQTVPGYFYRINKDGLFSDGSGCGNELATERKMVRKYIVESVVFWAKEYHLDGFRFDLMGLIDIETMNEIRQRLDQIDPSIYIYGEGWTAGPTPLSEKSRAVKLNTLKLNRIGSFCDDMRNALKGSPFDRNSTGFVGGATLREELVKFGITGAVYHDQMIYHFVETSGKAWANTPGQCVNYVSCHDNYTLYDKLSYSCPESDLATIERMAKLAYAIIFTSQGVPFLLSGDEMLRTKGGHHDSYRSPDLINQIDWSRKHQFIGLFDFIRHVIELRRMHPAFRMRNAELIRRHLRFFGKYIPGVIAYELADHANNDTWRRILVLFNGNNFSVEYEIPFENWGIIAQNGVIDPSGMGMSKTAMVRIHPISMMILAV